MTKESKNKKDSKAMQYDALLGTGTCDNCGAVDNFRDVTTDKIDYIETEKDRICNNCGELMDCWAYGYWQKASDCA